MSIIDLLSFVGGLAGGLRLIFGSIAGMVASEMLESRMIKRTYMLKNSDFLKWDVKSFSLKTTYAF